MANLSVWHWLIVAAIVYVIYRWLKGGIDTSPRRSRSDTVRQLMDEGRIRFPVAVHGESHYQSNIERVCAVGKSAELIHEPDNPYDKHAMRVDVDGRTIGYIPRDQAEQAKDEEWQTIVAAVYDGGSKPTGVVLGVTSTYRDKLRASGTKKSA